MSEHYKLTTDPREIAKITSERVMVSSALLYTFTAYYVFFGISFFFKNDVKKAAVLDMGRRLVLYGIAALLSINFLLNSIFHAIFAWILMILSIILHGMILMRGVQQSTKGIMIFLYYIILFLWYCGIIVLYFYDAQM